eukprot:scaffold26769_cov19-Tisochrysis_lutea.AAC.1
MEAGEVIGVITVEEVEHLIIEQLMAINDSTLKDFATLPKALQSCDLKPEAKQPFAAWGLDVFDDVWFIWSGSSAWFHKTQLRLFFRPGPPYCKPAFMYQ